MKETGHPPIISRGGIWELLILFLPLLGTAFANYIFLLVEKIYLARISVQAMESAVNVAYVCQIFQGSTMALTMMAQVFVGRWYGAKEYQMVGPGIWQFIWFSFVSMLITVPATILYGKWYFQGTAIETIAMPYFYLLVGSNFLYPLGVALSSFYFGQGKTRLVLLGSLASQVLKIVLGYLLIFGLGRWIPSFGLIGGGISTVIAQGGFCILLASNFLNRRHAALFDSWNWHFKLSLFWKCVHPGLLRSLNRISSFLSWASIAHLMTTRGGEHLLVLSIGGSIFLFLPFLSEAICQAQTTIVSQLLGAKHYALLGRAFRSVFLLVLALIGLSAIPFVLFPDQTEQLLFPGIELGGGLQKVFLGIWVCFAFSSFCSIPISYVLAFKDMQFSFAMGLVNWLNGYLLMYWVVETIQIPASDFWLALSVMHATTAAAYLWRMKKLCRIAQLNDLALA